MGCPVAIYLAGAGIGRMVIVDDDVVESSNLHRQILHTEDAAKRKTPKARSIRDAVIALNSNVRCEAEERRFTTQNGVALAKLCDVVIDCSDNVATRYVVNDACVIANKPLVSGAAVGFDGHVSIFNAREDCPCYRCIYPNPPTHAAVGTCTNNGVLGPTVGVLGSIMAMETVKLIAGIGTSLIGRQCIVDSWGCRFRNVRLPPRQKNCAVCRCRDKGVSMTWTMQDTVTFCNANKLCGGSTREQLRQTRRRFAEAAKLRPEHICTVVQYASLRSSSHVLIDVRPEAHFRICSLDGSINVPLDVLRTKVSDEKVDVDSWLPVKRDSIPVYTICRRGNDSQLAARVLLDAGWKDVRHIEGGLVAWASDVDHDFPVY